MQKDKGADQVIDVELEEPVNKNRMNYEILDDALYIITKVSVIAAQQNQTKAVANTASKPKPNMVKGSAEQAQWEREEETIRKKFERSSINMMKSKIA